MEDLGFYLGNYTAAGCMAWGHGEGCEFVKYRCAKRGGANSTAAADAEDCKGSPAWLTKPDAQVEAHCIGGIDPCANAAGGGYDEATGTCSLMCHTEGANACVQVQPEGEVEGSRVSKFLDRVQEVSWQQWVWLAVYIVGGASATAVHLRRPLLTMRHCRAHLSPFLMCVAGVLTVILFKRICCPPGRRVVLASVSALLMLTGLIVGVIVIVAITGVDVSAIAALQVTTPTLPPPPLHLHLHHTTSPPPPPSARRRRSSSSGSSARCAPDRGGHRVHALRHRLYHRAGHLHEVADHAGGHRAALGADDGARAGGDRRHDLLDRLARLFGERPDAHAAGDDGPPPPPPPQPAPPPPPPPPLTPPVRSTSAGQVRRLHEVAWLAAPEPRRGRRVPHVPGVLPRSQARRHRCDVVGQRHRLDGE